MSSVALSYVLYTVVMLALSVSLVVSFVESGRRRYVIHWVAYGFLYTLAIAVNAVPGISEKTWLIVLAYLLFMTAYMNLDLGFSYFVAGRVTRFWRITLITEGVFFVLIAVLGIVPRLFLYRFTLFNAWSMIVFGRIGLVLVLRSSGRSRRIPWLSVAGAMLISIGWLIRGVVAISIQSQSIEVRDAATVTSTMAVSVSIAFFTVSLMNLAQQRVANQLETVRAWMDNRTVILGQSNLIAGLAHSLGTPLGTAVLALSSLMDRSHEVPAELNLALRELDQTNRRLKALRVHYGGVEFGAPTRIVRSELAARLGEDLASFGIGFEDSGAGVSGSSEEMQLHYESFFGQLLDFFDLADSSGWLSGDSRRILLERKEDIRIIIDGLSIPEDIWDDVGNPLGRSLIRGFTETLLLSGIVEGLRSHPSVRSVSPFRENASGLDIVLRPVSDA